LTKVNLEVLSTVQLRLQQKALVWHSTAAISRYVHLQVSKSQPVAVINMKNLNWTYLFGAGLYCKALQFTKYFVKVFHVYKKENTKK